MSQEKMEKADVQIHYDNSWLLKYYELIYLFLIAFHSTILKAACAPCNQPSMMASVCKCLGKISKMYSTVGHNEPFKIMEKQPKISGRSLCYSPPWKESTCRQLTTGLGALIAPVFIIYVFESVD